MFLDKKVRIKLPQNKWHLLVTQIYERDKWQCVLCGNRTNLTPDHIIKRSQGGDDLADNLWTLCAFCHRRKDEYKLTDEELALIPTGTKYGEPCRFGRNQNK